MAVYQNFCLDLARAVLAAYKDAFSADHHTDSARFAVRWARVFGDLCDFSRDQVTVS